MRRKGICNVQFAEMWPRYFKAIGKAPWGGVQVLGESDSKPLVYLGVLS
jgi:hypothetical protein